jgi:hypothetical protein
VATDANGVAAFPGLSINQPGLGYTLRARVVRYKGTVPPASEVSQMFDVAP